MSNDTNVMAPEALTESQIHKLAKKQVPLKKRVKAFLCLCIVRLQLHLIHPIPTPKHMIASIISVRLCLVNARGHDCHFTAVLAKKRFY